MVALSAKRCVIEEKSKNTFKAIVDVSRKDVKALYNVMQSVEGRLGGGEGVEGLYGSITRSGMQKVVAALQAQCNLSSKSCLVDVGAGLGRPLLHAMVEAGLEEAFGVEIDSIKCQKAEAFLRQTQALFAERCQAAAAFALPPITCAAIEQVCTLHPATHAYSFWEGVPTEGKMAFGRLFAASRSLEAVAVVQRAIRGEQPAEVMAELGFGELLLTATFPVTMSGSGRSFRAYCFKRIGDCAAHFDAADAASLPCAQPDLVVEDSCARRAVLSDLQLGRIRRHMQATDTAEPLACQNAAVLRPDARIARRAARTSTSSAVGPANTSLAAKQPAKAVASASADDRSDVSSAAIVPSCASKVVPTLTSATGLIKASREPATDTPARTTPQRHDAGASECGSAPQQSSQHSSAAAQRSSPICTPAGSPATSPKGKRSPLKVRAGSMAKASGAAAKGPGAQRQLWGHARKTAAVTKAAGATAADSFDAKTSVLEHRLQLI